MRTRPAAVAGLFYPAEPQVLERQLEAWLADAPPGGRRPKALVAPHAGYVYSGPIAARAYAVLRALRGTIERVVLAGPAHRVLVRGAAIPSVDAFDSPLGPVRLDAVALARLAALDFVEVDDVPHAREHCLEVHLPFLQRALGDFALVPVVVGDATPAQAERLFETLWGGDETLIVVSTDLSHYLPYEEASRRDRETARAILRLDARVAPQDACGAHPLNGFLRAARRHGLQAELLDLRNSGDTAGDRDRVVGYGAFAFHA